MAETRFEVDADVRRAHWLDKAFYLDPAVFALARERVFARSWQWLGDTADVAAPGSLSPRELLPGLLDEPLLLARDAGGVLRALSNVCTHRAMPLVQAPCPAARITCGYHGRSFALDGRLLHMPGFEDICDFPTPRDNLTHVPFDTWQGHAFAALAPALPLPTLLAEMQQRMGALPVQGFVADPARSRDFSFDAHWALYVENYLEGLHIPYLHPGLTQTLALTGYHYELGTASVLQRAEARTGEAAFAPTPGMPGAHENGRRIAAWYWWLFPNLMFNFYPWGLSVNIVLPQSPTRTRVLFRAYVADASQLGQGAGGALDPVELEDEAAVQAVQRGLRSRSYRGGRYAPRHEAGVHHFHRLLCAAMPTHP